jgi:HAD superfamily hydrolase (TIGR01484 family)
LSVDDHAAAGASRISGLFTDYDGTLAPDDAPRSQSRVAPQVERQLSRLASMLPIAVITSKDYEFVGRRTRFARAWACASGLDIVMATGTRTSCTVAETKLRTGLGIARNLLGSRVEFEQKHGSSNRLIGFCVDWRAARNPPTEEAIQESVDRISSLGLSVVAGSGRHYFDVFGAEVDKGRCLHELKKRLDLSGSILYLGDSPSDNPAFDATEFGVGVDHGQDMEDLRCEFIVRPSELAGFLESLADNELVLDVRKLRRNHL